MTRQESQGHPRSSAANGEAAIERAAREATLANRVYRSEGDLWTDTPINLSKFVRFLALQPHVVPTDAQPEQLRLEWRDGAPSKPWALEWFIAETTFGDRVCLVALPDEWTYDFKTADDTYIKADKIKRWMQFPDSNFIAPASQPSPAATVEREQIEWWEGQMQLAMAEIERLRVESLERQEQICETNDRLMAAQDQAHLSAETCDECGKQFQSNDDVVLLPKRGNFHQECFLRKHAQPQPTSVTRPASVLGGVPTDAELATAWRYLLEKPSTSYIQRKMGIGYNRASAIIETLENEGILSKPDSTGKRTTLTLSRPKSAEG